MHLMLDSNKSSLNDPFLDKEWMGVEPLNVLPTDSPSSFYREYEAVLTPDQTMQIITRLQHQPLTCAAHPLCLSLSCWQATRTCSSTPVPARSWGPNNVYIYIFCQGAVSSSCRCPRHRTVTYVDVLTLCSKTNGLLWEKGWLLIFHPLVRLYEILLDLFCQAVFLSDF